MPRRTVPGTDLEYFLVSLDEQGGERTEPDGSLLSDEVARELRDTSRPVTDVFLCSHGWKGDVPAAVKQYDRWLAAMLSCEQDRTAVRARRPDFRAVVVGLHWPSLPWGDEQQPGPGGVLSDEGAGGDESVDTWAARIAGTDEARRALAIVLADAAGPHQGLVLPEEVRSAYSVLYEQSGLVSTAAPTGPPGAEQVGFDPQLIIEEADAAMAGAGGPAPTGPGLLGGGGAGDRLKDLLLMPVRQLSFWKMKDRGRRIGEGGAHDLLLSLKRAAPGARFHLMGHSFGCIVVSGAVAGAGAGGAAARGRAVDSLFLVQGALSLWSYARDVPFGGEGYYARVLEEGAASGPIATTTSDHDTAVRVLYPLGAKVKKQYLLDREELPRYGGVGCFGLQGLGARATDLAMAGVQHQYRFAAGQVHNLKADKYIRGGGGLSGAHSAITSPEVAHVQWQLVLGAS